MARPGHLPGVRVSEAQTVEVQARNWRVPPAALALVAPEVGMERVARTGRVRGPLLVALACALLSAGAGVLRVDAKDATLRAMDKAGELQRASEREVARALQLSCLVHRPQR